MKKFDHAPFYGPVENVLLNREKMDEECILCFGTEFTTLCKATVLKEFWGKEYGRVQMKSAFGEIVETNLHDFYDRYLLHDRVVSKLFPAILCTINTSNSTIFLWIFIRTP